MSAESIVDISLDKLNLEESSSSQPKVERSDFEILKKVGRGTFGEVFIVQKHGSGNYYAMKVQRKDAMAPSKKLINCALEELEILKSLNSPFINKLIAAFNTPQRLYLVFEFIYGGDMFRFLRAKNTLLEEKDVKFYLSELVIGIAYLHKMNVVHRDLKLENMMLTSEGHIKIIDFGLSKSGMLDERRTYTACGTLRYLSPEQVSRVGYTKNADWGSFGIIMLEMITGTNPYELGDTEKTKAAIMSPDNPHSFNLPNLTGFSKNLVHHLLVREGQRYKAEEIKKHPFFDGIDWNAVEDQKVPPPWKMLKSEGIDLTNFYRAFTMANPEEAECASVTYKKGYADPFLA